MTNFDTAIEKVALNIRKNSAAAAQVIMKAAVTTPERTTLVQRAIDSAFAAGKQEAAAEAEAAPAYQYTYLKLSAGADTDGNPRRLYIVSRTKVGAPDQGAERVAIFRENYDGNQEVRRCYPQAVYLMEVVITPAEFKKWIGVKKSDEEYRKEELLEALNAAGITYKTKKETEAELKLAFGFYSTTRSIPEAVERYKAATYRD